MRNTFIMKLLVYVLLILGCQALTIQSENCKSENKVSGTIEDDLNAKYEERCWIIRVPRRKFTITITVNSLSFEDTTGTKSGIEIKEIKTGKGINMTKNYEVPKMMTFGSDVKITHYVRSYDHNYIWRSIFKLSYKLEKGIPPVNFNVKFPDWGVSWLKNQSSNTMDWKEDTPRAVVALFLASAVNFDGTVFEEELMANQVELKTSAALLKSSNTVNELSMLVNALLVTCYNPRKFHDIDVVKRLKTLVERSPSVTHPVAYLALCNANEMWPEKAFDDLNSILNTTSDFQLNTDMKAMAVMAISCYLYHREIDIPINKSIDTFEYDKTIEHFIAMQREDGSFGNVYTTSLIAQALLSDLNQDWKVNATAGYLVRKLNTAMNFLTAYLALPFLNGKSLVDIINTNCSAHPRKHGNDPFYAPYTQGILTSEASKEIEFLGAPKNQIADENKEVVVPIMQIKYSLYIGDKKDVIQAIFISVPLESTAYQVMELAASENPKYKFQSDNVTGIINIFEIADIPNDPENAKYWMLYVSPPNNQERISYSTQSPNELILKNGQHLVMWYRSHQF